MIFQEIGKDIFLAQNIIALSFVWTLNLFSFFFFSYILHYFPEGDLLDLTFAQGLGMLASAFYKP
jgi:hypothetical protein